MKYQIFYPLKNGEDSFTIEGNTLAEVQEKAAAELLKRDVYAADARGVKL